MSAVPDPDDPPWGVVSALLLWLASVVALGIVPAFAVVAYVAATGQPLTPESMQQALTADPRGILTSIAAVIPTHLLTVALAWAVVTGFGRRPFWPTLGWRFGAGFGPWTSAGLAVGLLVLGGLIVHFAGGAETDLDQIINSSPGARFTTAFLATASAPFVEELIYRGVLYPAMQRAAGVLWAVFTVSTLFALVHTLQYRNNYGVIAVIAILSFTLTAVRAATKSLLPCFVIHLVFNGIQSAYIVYQHFNPQVSAPATPGSLHVVAAPALSSLLGLSF